MKAKFPPQIKFIIGNEAAERFSFYGMRSILTVFMVGQLLIPEPEAKAIYHLFVGACYLMPLLGAFISDFIWGKYKTIMILSLFYCLGHGVLALWESKTTLYIGLGLIALGAGGIKPCVSAFVGDQFTEENKSLLSKVFDLFYWSVNFGAFFSSIMIPWTKTHFGSRIAFGIPGILMAIATGIFWMGTRHYINIPPKRREQGRPSNGLIAIFLEALKNRNQKRAGRFLDNALGKYSVQEVDAVRAILGIGKVYVTVSIFWALFDQSGSSWVLQGQKMGAQFMGIQLDPSQLQALNPIMVLIMIPLFSYGIYPAIEKKWKGSVTPLRKMGAGMVIASFSFFTVTAFEVLLSQGVQLNMAWQILPYLVLTAAEILVSITGLEFAYTQAPASMKSTVMSLWLMTVFLGNMLTAFVSKINIFSGSSFFLFFAVLMLGVSGVFIVNAKSYKVRDYHSS